MTDQTAHPNMAQDATEQTTRNRSISTGTSGLPEHEHKRPRLDIETMKVSDSWHKNENVMAEAPRSRTISPESAGKTPSVSTPPSDLQTAKTHANIISPGSKMAILTRTLSSHSAGAGPNTEADLSRTSDADHEQPSSLTMDSVALEEGTDGHKVQHVPVPELDFISIVSTPEHAQQQEDDIPIEIYPPQDASDSEATVQPTQDTLSRQYLWESLPFLTENSKIGAVRVLKEITDVLETGPAENFAEVLRAVTMWLQSNADFPQRQGLISMQTELDFYRRLVNVFQAPFRRRSSVPPEISSGDIMGFVSSFAHLTMSLAEADLQFLSTIANQLTLDQQQSTLAPDYLRCLSPGLVPETSLAFSETIMRARHTRDEDFHVALIHSLARERNIPLFNVIARLFQALSEKIPSSSPSRIVLFHLVQSFHALLQLVVHQKDVLEDNHLATLHDTVEDFVLKADAVLQQAIIKQHPWLSIENCLLCVDGLVRIVAYGSTVIPSIAKFALERARMLKWLTRLSNEDEYFAEALRLAFYKQLIQHGRMELRVWGMEQMATLFVSLWTKTLRLQPSDSQALVSFVIDFVRENDMIRYILSTESHPQVIQRSSNILGFLCISCNWLESDTDAAWHAIVTSEDPRSRSAVIDMLKANFEHLGIDPLLYLLFKLKQTPFEQIDTRILDLNFELLHALRAKNTQASHSTNDVNLRICEASLHLLRESHVQSRTETEIAGIIRYQLSEIIIQQGSVFLDSIRQENILEQMCEDIRAGNEHANGSIVALTALLKSLSSLQVVELVDACDLGVLLVNDIANLADHISSAQPLATEKLDVQFRLRCDCILALNHKAPQAFDASLCELYWKRVLTSDIPEPLRARIWKDLAAVANLVHSPSPLLQSVSTQLQHSLGASEFSMSVLDFAKAVTTHELRQQNKSSNWEEPLTLATLENVWRIMLEADDPDVKTEATKFIVNVYLDNSLLNRRSTTSIGQTHALLVERCMQIVKSCAGSLKPDHSNGAIEGNDSLMHLKNQTMQQCTQIHRALELLRTFLDAMKLKPRYKPTATETLGPLLLTLQKRGDPLEINIRVVNHPRMRDEMVTWTVGTQNTADEIFQFLRELTGWSVLNLINAGTRLQFQGSEVTMEEVKLGPGPIAVSKHMTAEDLDVKRGVQVSSPVDSQVMHHFDDLYALLESLEPIAKAVYGFLSKFPPQDSIVSDIRSLGRTAEELLPVDKPFKLLYFTTVLRACIEEESFSSTPNSSFLVYSIHTIIDTLNRLHSIELPMHLRKTMLKGQMEALQLALRARVPEDISKTYLGEPAAFVKTMVDAWESLNPAESPDLSDFTRHILTVFFEASLHQLETWSHMERNEDFRTLLRSALLICGHTNTRQAAQTVIQRLAGVNDGKIMKGLDNRSMRSRFPAAQISMCLKNVWNLLQPLVLEACAYPENCRETFESSVSLLHVIAKELKVDRLLALYSELQDLLLQQHDPARHIFCANEMIVQCLARLLSDCINALKLKGESAPGAKSLARDAYQQFLFPPLSDESIASTEHQSTPILAYEARVAVYDMILAAVQCRETLDVLVQEMADSSVDEDAFSCVMLNEKKALRSSTGYSGLKNLSNTCYLNSLFSQLFMNLKFRELIMGIDVVDPEKQKLLSELASCFASMQSSSEKYIDPSEAVDSIVQYTGDSIDVTVQMDVDEFFNLLFDRLEAQIFDTDAQKLFKSMYGGTLVQQIKSKECEHISERTEPFSAVQIEIRGKSGLEEGLSAYVEGEVLQGDNKYSCTGCGRHVDAIKRACIKEMPDNLIFNLKRFDYDIMTGMRAKINDEFEFPQTIDMTPYTVEALSHPDKRFPADIFELVGVIVHSGTAETGHYYSFIRERPTKKCYDSSWIQFNDADVTPFDPEDMKDQAFGGQDSTFNSLTKFYNGYMLFYQRKSSIKQYEKQFHVSGSKAPAVVPLRRDLENTIAQQNEITLRRYVAQDPAHAQFIKSVIQLMRFDDQMCTEDHELERKVLTVVLEYIQQVGSRWKDLPDFEPTIRALGRYAQSCWKCSFAVCDWASKDHIVLDCVLRSGSIVARRGFAQLFHICSETLFAAKQNNESCSKADSDAITDVLKRMFASIIQDWGQIQRFPRGWDQLFGMLVAIANIGHPQCRFLIELEFLEQVIEIVWIHAGPGVKGTLKSFRGKYLTYFAQREKHKSFNHTPALQLFARLLPGIALDELVVPPKEEVLQASDAELTLLQIKDSGSFEWLRRLVHYGACPQAACEVVRELCQYPRLLPRVHETLVTVGVQTTREYHAAAKFLEPTLTFVAASPEKRYAMDAVNKTLQAVADTDGYCAEDYCTFVHRLSRLGSTNSGMDNMTIRGLILRNVEHWAPMLLLASTDVHRDVRQEAATLLEDILFSELHVRAPEDIQDDEMTLAMIRALCRGCANHFAKYFAGLEQDRASARISYSTGQNRQMVAVLEEIAQVLGEFPEEMDVVHEAKTTIADLQLLDTTVEDNSLRWDDNSEALSEVELSENSL